MSIGLRTRTERHNKNAISTAPAARQRSGAAIDPSPSRALDESEDPQREPAHERERAQRIGQIALHELVRSAFAKGARAQRDHDHAERNADPERPSPRADVDEDRAERRAQCGRDAADARPRRDRRSRAD